MRRKIGSMIHCVQYDVQYLCGCFRPQCVGIRLSASVPSGPQVWSGSRWRRPLSGGVARDIDRALCGHFWFYLSTRLFPHKQNTNKSNCAPKEYYWDQSNGGVKVKAQKFSAGKKKRVTVIAMLALFGFYPGNICITQMPTYNWKDWSYVNI